MVVAIGLPRQMQTVSVMFGDLMGVRPPRRRNAWHAADVLKLVSAVQLQQAPKEARLNICRAALAWQRGQKGTRCISRWPKREFEQLKLALQLADWDSDSDHVPVHHKRRIHEAEIPGAIYL